MKFAKMGKAMASRRTPTSRRNTVSRETQEVPATDDGNLQRGAHLKSGAPLLTAKIWNRLRHNGRLVREEVAGHLSPELRPLVWKEFQQLPMARWACSLIQLIEPQPADAGLYRRRARRPTGAGLFDDITSLSQRFKAERIYADLCDRHAERLPSCPWLLPILAGRARDLALRPEAHGSEHGRRMRRIKGGIHVQRRYREQGWHPLASVRKAWGLTADRPRTAR
jgi:hypothetical protein